MAGGGFSGLTRQTLRPLSCGSDTPEDSGPPDHIQVTVNGKFKKRTNMTHPSIPDWISAISSFLGIPLIIWGIIKIFKKDKAQERKLTALENLAVSQNEVINKMTEEINELAKQTSEYQYQSSLMEQSNKLIGKQIEIQNDIFLHNKVTEQRKQELQEIERMNKVKPHFTFTMGTSSSINMMIKLKNKGATAKKLRIEKIGGDFIQFRNLKFEDDIENGKIIEISANINSNAPGFNNLQRAYELELFFEDIDGRAYKQRLINNRINNPEKIDT